MRELLPLATRVGAALKACGETVAIAESSTGGLLAAALLALPGASAYFLGGCVVYTRAARRALLGIQDVAMQDLRPSTEAYALLLARSVRERLGAAWGVGESGAAGPEGNRYGDPAGHSCIAIAGPTEHVITLDTGTADRAGNMRLFAHAALDLMAQSLSAGARS